MSVRFRILHNEYIAGTQVAYRADIHDTEYTGAINERLVSNNFFDWEYERIDEQSPFDRPVQKSTFRIDLLVRDQVDMDLLNDILDAPESRFETRFYINDTHKWSGKVLTDLLEYGEKGFPFPCEIRAKDLSPLEGIDFPLVSSAGLTRLSVIISDCLKETGLTLPIRSYTNLTNTEVDQGQDFLYALYHRKFLFRNRNAPLTCYEVLENICRAYSLLIRQSDGRWIIDQLPAVARGNDIQFDYDANGLNPVSSTPSRTIVIDDDSSFLLPTSQNIVTGALKSIESEYKHRTQIIYFDIDDVTHTFSGDKTEHIEEFGNDGNMRLSIDIDAEAYTEDVAGPIEGKAYFRVWLIRSDNVPLFMDNSGAFSAGTKQVEIDLVAGPSSSTGSISIPDTDPLNAGVVEVKIEFLWAVMEGGFEDTREVSKVEFKNIDIIAFNQRQDVIAEGATIRHRYTRDGEYSVTEDAGATFLGDGPTLRSVGAPASAALITSIIPYGKFRIRGQDEELSLEEIKLRERLSMRRNSLLNMRADLLMNYSPEKLISYRDKTWFFLGGSFQAQGSMWRSNIIAIAHEDDDGDIFEPFLDTELASVNVVGVSILREIFNNTNFNENQAITTTTADITGTVTEIPILAVGSQVLSVGDIFYLFNTQGASLTEFTLAEPQLPSHTTLVVEPKAIDETIVSGSWVIFTGEKIANYITRSDSGIRLGVRSYEQGELDGDAWATEGGDDFALVDGDDYKAGSRYTSSEIAILQGEIVLKARTNGRLAMVRLDSNPVEGSLIEIQADNIDIDSVVTSINATEALEITAPMIDIDGVLNVVNDGGTVGIDGGAIKASSRVTVGTGDNVAVLSGDHSSTRIWAGNSDPSAAPFRVLQNGNVIATRFVQLDGEEVDGVITNFSVQNLKVTGKIFTENEETVFDENGIGFKLPEDLTDNTSLVWVDPVGGGKSSIGSDLRTNRPTIVHTANSHQFIDDFGITAFDITRNPNEVFPKMLMNMERIFINTGELPKSYPDLVDELYLHSVSDPSGDYYELRIRKP